ncbi:Lrp/AsnC family transcriptional regulator [Vallitalea okinawensis]|uniref:Lrp/AsnC family transcriptional regulator n=1 Tax=Vallitalea okinawensis TaxID=2078660 RepID=UPI000CFDDF0E|nr:Lrp/AsnC family transcriptional regulator [Vallitalea okinawensis]
MDKIDLSIIHLLQQNARMSISEISSKVNLSISAVSERLKKLENSNLIKQYTAIINPESFQKDLTVIMFVSLERSQYSTKFMEFVETEEEVLECHYIAGTYDYALKVITKNTESLQSIINKLKSLPGIRKTQTNVVLSSVKNNYSITPKLEETKKKI